MTTIAETIEAARRLADGRSRLEHTEIADLVTIQEFDAQRVAAGYESFVVRCAAELLRVAEETKPPGLNSDVAIRAHMEEFPEFGMPKTLAGRLEQIHDMLNFPMVDEKTGKIEYVAPISTETAKRLLDGIDGVEEKP